MVNVDKHEICALALPIFSAQIASVMASEDIFTALHDAAISSSICARAFYNGCNDGSIVTAFGGTM